MLPFTAAHIRFSFSFYIHFLSDRFCVDIFRSKVEEERLSVSKATIGSIYNVIEPAVNDTAVYLNTSSANITASHSDEWGWLPSTETCIYVYSALVISIVVFVVCSAMCFFTLCMRASIRLHNSMFANITRATMWFFNNNPSGNLDITQCVSWITLQF